jgi:geranylgeranyl transferase type-2 subunit alpha
LAIESGVEFTKEFEFSTEKIEENFSNYSAFHHRSVFIKSILNSVTPITQSSPSELDNNFDSSLHYKDLNDNYKFEFIQNTINGDVDIIENAVFTEPDDQSAWW